MRVALAVAAAVAAGVALASCGGGGNARSTPADPQATTPAGTVSVERTRSVTATPTIETTTTVITTNGPPTTTLPPPVTETTTETTVATATVAPPTTTAPTTAGTTGTTSSSSKPPSWVWIVVGLAVVAALAIGFALWRRHRAGATSWSAQREDLTRRALVASDDVMAQGSVVTGQIEALAAEARSLEARAPDDASRADAARLRTRLDDLGATLEADRSLRLASPPPTPEQLSYSTALIRQQVEQLHGVLRPPGGGSPS